MKGFIDEIGENIGVANHTIASGDRNYCKCETSVTGQTETSRVGYIKGAMRDIVFIQMGTVIGYSASL